MDKKAQYTVSKELLLWLIRFLVVFVVVIFILAFLGQHVQRQLNIDSIRSDIIKERLFYSQDCFSYKDENGIQVGVININKFDESILNNCIKYSNAFDGIGLTLNLTYEDVSKIVYINRIVANKFPAFCPDEDNFACFSEKNYILVKDNQLKKGVLEISTIQQK